MDSKQSFANKLWNDKWQQFKEENKLKILLDFADYKELRMFLMNSSVKRLTSPYEGTFIISEGKKQIEFHNDFGEGVGIKRHNIDEVIMFENKNKICELVEGFPIRQAVLTGGIQKNNELKAFLDYYQLNIEDINFSSVTYGESLQIGFNNRYFYVFSEEDREGFIWNSITNWKIEEQKRLGEKFQDEYNYKTVWDFYDDVFQRFGEDYFINQNRFSRIEHHGYYIYEK